MSIGSRRGRTNLRGSSYVAAPAHRSWSRSDKDGRPSLTPSESAALQQRLWALLDGD
nr:hypothetical protein [uncultured Novosphingobium sp.]